MNPRSMNILHLEDSPEDAELVEAMLRAEWPECSIQRVCSEADYRAALGNNGIDIILSDYSLPGYSGLEALELARELGSTKPFIFISGTIGEERAVEALKRGAFDYVIKDRPTRLVPAIRLALAHVEASRRHREAEEALKKNREYSRLITENVGDMIAVRDAEGRFLYANPAYRSLIGDAWSRNGDDPFSVIHPDDRERVRANYQKMVRKGKSGTIEYRLTALDGRVHHIEARGSVIHDADNNLNVLVVARDVTEHREAAERIRDQAALLDKARDAIIVTDMDRRIAYWNAGAERLHRRQATEVVGQPLHELDLGFDQARMDEAWALVVRTGEWRGNLVLRPKSGELRHVESSWSLVADAAGRPRAVLQIETDVTAERRLEAQLMQAQRLESLGTMAGGIAHDLNNVLAPIVMSLDLLRERLAGDATALQLLDIMGQRANHGVDLIRQILTFARGKEGVRTDVSPTVLLGEVDAFLRGMLPKRVTLTFQPMPALSPVLADATQLKQVIINLCLNACDAMPQGGRIDLSAEEAVIENGPAGSVSPFPRPGSWLHIRVADTGTGIAPEHIDRIFDPFFTTKPTGKGTGLGLSIAHGIVKSHGGFIHVDSVLGAGTTFHLYLPFKKEDEAKPA